MIGVERIDWDGEAPAALASRLRSAVAPLASVTASVAEIVARVRDGGDAAVRELARGFGEPAPQRSLVDPAELEAARASADPSLVAALELTARNIEAVARSDLDACGGSSLAELPEGQAVEVERRAVGAAGVYAPGGRAAYPSSVLMCAIPARVAGVGRIAVATPPGPAGRPPQAVLAACAIAGVDEVHAIGGAQAVAALAFGTESVAAVDVIAGPGNRYVTEAKRLVFGQVGIDGLAGPSELLVVAAAGARPRWVALDACAQAEHAEDSSLIVVSPDPALLDAVAAEVAELSPARASVAAATLALVASPGLDAALALADAFAPEHLELAFDGADGAARGRVAGCVFVGPVAATAFGDYAAGSNHVLPTGGAARFGGPLGPGAFLRRTSVVSIPRIAAEALAPKVGTLAAAEGLPVHGESALARIESDER